MGGWVIQNASPSTTPSRRRAPKRNARAGKEPKVQFDFARLERAVEQLVIALGEAREDNAQLRSQIESKVRQIAELDARNRSENQKRRDVVKRLDDLIAQIETLERQHEQPNLLDDPGD